MQDRPSFALFFLKASNIPPGARWITVHPHGDGKGQPVLVQPVAPGSSTVHVIGGAGGKLNYLKLTGVKSTGDYAKESAERGKERRAVAAAQRKKDAELGVTGVKAEARKEIAVKKRAAEQDFIHTVAEAMGWNSDALAFDEAAHAGLPEAARAKALNEHHRQLLGAAREAVQLQRKRLLIDADARQQAFTGEMPLHTDDVTQLSVADLDPVRGNHGLGFDPQYKARAEAAGLTAEEVQEEKDAAQAQAETDAIATPDVKPPKKATVAQKIKAELDKVNADRSDLRARLVDVKQAVALLKAQKQLTAIQQSARAGNAAIDRSVEPARTIPKARYWNTTSPPAPSTPSMRCRSPPGAMPCWIAPWSTCSAPPLPRRFWRGACTLTSAPSGWKTSPRPWTTTTCSTTRNCRSPLWPTSPPCKSKRRRWNSIRPQALRTSWSRPS